MSDATDNNTPSAPVFHCTTAFHSNVPSSLSNTFLLAPIPPTPRWFDSNICHGSDSAESAAKEIALWFPEGLCSWESCSASWIYE